MTQVFTIQRPSRTPTDQAIREAIYIQQQGEIAFSLGEDRLRPASDGEKNSSIERK